MRYRRKTTRPPRAVEENAALQEAAKLRIQLERMTKALLGAEERIYILELVQDELQRDIGRLVVELRHERNKVNFLQGFDGLGHEPWDIRRIFG